MKHTVFYCLQLKINSFDTSVTEFLDIDDTDNGCNEAKPGFYTEEDLV